MPLDRITVFPGAELSPDPGQTPQAMRLTGVSPSKTETGLWYGKVITGAGEMSSVHHHAEAATGGYVLSGDAFIRFGDGFEEILYLTEGDFIYVPPFIPHIEGNASRRHDLVWLTARTPDNLVVNLENEQVTTLSIDYRD